MKKYLQKGFKIFLWIIGTIIVLFFAFVIALQTTTVQKFAKQKAVAYLQEKIKTKVSVDTLELGFPEKIILKGVYFEDQKKDTLFAGRKLAANISLLQLMNNKVQVNSIELEGITAHLNRDSKAVFNFDYIVKAFARPEKQKGDSPPMQFSVEKITLDHISFRYNDEVTKINLYANLNHFDTTIKSFDLNKMSFEIPKAKVNGLRGTLKQGLVKISRETKIAAIVNAPDDILKLKMDEIDLAKIDFDFESDEKKIASSIYVKKLLAKIDKIDIGNQLLLIKSFDLTGVEGGLTFGKLDKIAAKKAPAAALNNWEVKVAKTEFKRVNFKYDDNNFRTLGFGVDYNHLDITKLNLQMDALYYNPVNVSGIVNALSLKDKSGLDIEVFKSDFFFGKKNATFKNLYIKTPQSEVRDEILLGYPSIPSLVANPGELSINAKLKRSKVAVRDLLLFAPQLRTTNPFMSNRTAILRLNGTVRGKVRNLELPAIEISGIGSTRIAASGRIIGLPNVNTAFYDLNVKSLQSTSQDLKGILPPGTIPNTIQFPSQFSAVGTFKGTIAAFYTNMNVVSSFGNAKIKGTFDQSRKGQEKYDVNAVLNNFSLGRFIKNNAIGKVTLNGNFKGTGFNLNTASSTFNGTVRRIYYNKYNYSNLNVRGNIRNGNYTANVVARDPNLRFDLVSSGSFKDKYPRGKFKMNLDIADLEKLHLHAGPLKIRGVIDADIQSGNLDYLNGTFDAHHIAVANAKEEFVIDSINVVAISNASGNTLLLKSPFMDGEIIGKYKLTSVANAVANSVAKYYDSNPNSKKVATGKQQFAFKIKIKDNPILLKIVPELKSLEPIDISGRYNSVNDSIVLNGTVPKLVYGENTITNAIVSVDTKDKALVYSFMVDDIQNKQFQLPYTNLSGAVQNNLIDYTLQLKDSKDVERYLISGTLLARNGSNELNLESNDLKLNYEPWTIAKENLVRFGKKGIYAENFELSKNGSSITLQSQSKTLNAPLAINFKDFDIKTITSFVEKSDIQMSGKINGSAEVKNLMTSPLFTSDLNISDFTFKKDTIGNVSIKVNNAIANRYDAKVEITGQGNQVNLDGNYKATDGSFDLNLAIEKLNLKSIQGFTLGNIKESTGFFTGNFKINGTTAQPKVVGELKFNEIGFKAAQLNSTFKSINDKIIFTPDAIVFNNFIINDERDNDLRINGKIDSKNFRNFGFDLTLDAENFKAVNSQAKDNPLYYGELYLDNHLNIYGNFDNPIIDGNVRINEDTKFTVVVPQADPSVADREGIVEFIDQDNPQRILENAIQEITDQSDIKGFNVSVNIEVDKDAELSLIIDKANGDFLKLKGEAQLTGGIDPSGKTTLTGRYELKEGSYEMSFNAIKRKFEIESGSYILWTGEPTSANISVTAIYKTQAAPIDLVSDQIVTVTPYIRNTYKQKIPFETKLIMTGELLKPTITFDIILPEGNNSVSTEIINTTQAKLSQLRQNMDEMNKQVFALLLLNRFIGENPFASEAGSVFNVGAFARQSASKILSQQLNNLAGNLINGVELNFDLNTADDFTTGQRENRTDLSVGVSKRLLNDRLKVTVGSSFALEGPQQTNQDANNIAGDISVEYQISKDGRYKMRAYRLNKYQVALQGEVIETGVAFTITLDYNKFRELFMRSKAKK